MVAILEANVLRDKAMEIMQFIFTRSQENLVKNMPWGDDNYPNHKGRKDTTITDKGGILKSAIPPYWRQDNTLTLQYTNPVSKWVEYGTSPHPVAADKLEAWVRRKLGKKKPESMSIAYAIANKIRTEGVLPHPFLRPALHEAQRKYGIEIQEPMVR